MSDTPPAFQKMVDDRYRSMSPEKALLAHARFGAGQLIPTAAAIALLAFSAGCHKKLPPTPVADVAGAQLEAQQAVAKAKLEAKNGVKSAVKNMGPDSKDAARARISGAFDIAMTRADGDRSVANEKCLTLEQPAQQACKDKVEADYQAAVSQAKAKRDSQLQAKMAAKN